MASRRNILISTSALLGLAAVGAVIFVVARQGDGNQVLAQAPLNIETQIKPAFIMAVDDSGSMTFHNQLPAADGYGCWSRNKKNADWSFFNGNALRTSTPSGGSCSYSYSYTGPRIGTGYYGIPPIDAYGFARSPDFNPAYFDPAVTYEPWLNSDGSPYGSSSGNPLGNASTSKTRIDPRSTGEIALAGWLEDASSRSRFQAIEGMYFPQGTVYRLVEDDDCGNLDGDEKWRTVGKGGITLDDSCAVYVKYWPATFFLKTNSIVDADGAAVPEYGAVTPEEITNACGSGCSLWKYTIKTTDTVALQNFANWYSFYGNRNRAMVAGMTRSLSDINSMRVGYFTINSASANVTMRDMAVPADRSGLYASMLALAASGSTPNLTAVKRIGEQFRRTDSGAPVALSCQKNAGMLFTDGFSNASETAAAVTGLGAPFDNTVANSMAAIASRYYFDTSGGDSPLRTDLLAGNVPVPDQCSVLAPTSVEWKRLDCQKNLHMNFYGVTLGGRGDVFDPDISQDPYVLNPTWPGYTANSRSTVDDIWHATVNTRGQFTSARTPSDITAAMRRILESVGSGSTPSGSIALTGSRVGPDSLSVVPFYASVNNGTDWYSTLTAQSVSKDTLTGAVVFAKSWEATEKLPLHGARKIWVAKTSGPVKPTLAEFSSGTVNLDELCSNNVPVAGVTRSRCTATTITGLGVTLDQAVDYLRGDTTQESATTGTLRRRTKVLGDIVNSSPVVSASTDDYGYRSLRGATAGSFNPYAYDAYLTTKKARVPMVYAAANDGMLHAFHGATGVEQFAYIPATVLGHMGNLLTPYSATASADQKFQHRYYVDGPISVSDAYMGSLWKTVLVGTAGAGGRGVFALDVSTPGSFGNGSVLWEVNDKVSNTGIKNNIGHVLGKPIIVPVKVGTTVAWKAIFGNGYGSINGKAALFVVNLADGAVTTVLADESDATLPSKNGLGNLVVLDRFVGSSVDKGSDGYGDTVYAGDQNGAIWKFDLRSATPAAQSTPFYVAKDAGGNRQSITGGFAAASGPGGGLMLYFGTGSFSFAGDTTDTSMQSLYGVQDREIAAYTVAGRSDFQQQKVLVDTAGNRTVTVVPSAVGTKGWYLDLGVSGNSASATAQGERAVGNPVVEGGLVFFPTYQPTVSSGCSTTGLNRLYGLNALSGGAALSQVRMGSLDATPTSSATGALALTTGGSAPVRDVAVLTTARPAPLTCVPGTPGCAEKLPPPGCSMVVQVSGAVPMYIPRACGRQSWRQVR